MTAQPHLISAYEQVVDALARRCPGDFYRPSEWWDAELRRCWSHPTAKHHVCRVGRGGDKSRMMDLAAVVELAACSARPPVGERWWWVKASNRLDGCKASVDRVSKYLEVCGFAHTRVDDRIELSDAPVGFLALPCSQKATRGPRSIGGGLDELASWNVEGVNPAEDVAASFAAMAIVSPESFFRYYSSPLGTLDFHAQLYAKGDDGIHLVASAPSWVANPGGITRAAAWSAARGDERIFRREYEAIPQQGSLAAFDLDFVDRAMKPRRGERFGARVLIMDPSSGRSDAWTWAICRLACNAARTDHWIEVERVDGVSGSFWQNLSAEALVDKIAKLCADEKIQVVHADQREAYALSSLFAKKSISYQSHAWTNVSKIDAVEKVRRWLREETIALPDHPKLRDEMAAFEEKLTPSGAITFAGRSSHDDFVSLLLTLGMVDLPSIGNAEHAAIWGQPIDGGRWADSPGRGF